MGVGLFRPDCTLSHRGKVMANESKNAGSAAVGQDAKGKGPGKGKRLSRAERGLPELTAAQKQQRSMVQQAQNACTFIKAAIDSGEPVKAEVLRACATLAGSLAGTLGEE